VKILVDTHIFLWSLSEPNKLSETKRDLLESAANMVLVSSITITEIMIKASLGALIIPFNPLVEVERCGFELLDFCGADAMPLGELPFHHRDPFDRMLIAQGIARGLPIMTDDPAFRRYPCKLL
jgi:PIN domain nuclease of toxin-antitoxin system